MEAALLELIIQGGTWFVGCMAAFIVGKLFVQYVNKERSTYRDDTKEEKDRLYSIIESQNDLLSNQGSILEQQKQMLENTNRLIEQQISMEMDNREVLNALVVSNDKMTEIQMLHANRLERIEDRLERVERNQELK